MQHPNQLGAILLITKHATPQRRRGLQEPINSGKNSLKFQLLPINMNEYKYEQKHEHKYV